MLECRAQADVSSAGRESAGSSGLPQGVPTSPRLSNLVNFGMDAALAEMARQKRCTYTRYADDMTFSMTYRRSTRPGSLVRGVIQAARRIAKKQGYQLNGRKSVVLRRHQQQRVTGLVVNERVALARRTRRWLRAVEHRARTGKQTSLSDAQLQGVLALKRMVDRGGDGNRRQ